MQSWGFYQLVDAPNKADLILSLRGLSPITGVAGDADNVYSVTTPSFQIAFIDPHTNVTLWTLTSPVIVAGNRTQQAHWQQISLTNLISRIKVLANQPLSAAETAALTTYPATHFKRNLLIVVGGTAALGAGGFLLVHGLYEHGLASGKAQQDAFCNANNIPLSECAGG